jgi:hypothetical protein
LRKLVATIPLPTMIWAIQVHMTADMSLKSVPRIAAAVAAIMLVVALLWMPHGYYTGDLSGLALCRSAATAFPTDHYHFAQSILAAHSIGTSVVASRPVVIQ